MSTLRNNLPKNNFTIVENQIADGYGGRIGLKAAGMYLHLCSKPDGWTFSAKRMAKIWKDGECSIKNTLKELESAGLLARKRVRGGKMEYILLPTELCVSSCLSAKTSP